MDGVLFLCFLRACLRAGERPREGGRKRERERENLTAKRKIQMTGEQPPRIICFFKAPNGSPLGPLQLLYSSLSSFASLSGNSAALLAMTCNSTSG